MFTQCPKCETVFRLSAEVLRSAGGQVRCGRCGDVFNALARLAEEPDVFEPGESPLDLEARADHILESAPEDPAAVVGPVITAAARSMVADAVAAGRAAGLIPRQ